jgi:membrane carboxypeptidase/penicillin-binding protein
MDPNNHEPGEDTASEYYILKHWVQLCALPIHARHAVITSYHQAAIYSQRNRVREALEESSQATQHLKAVEAELAQHQRASETPNSKKKQTVDAKISEAVEDIKTALSGLTRLQRKRVLRLVREDLSE